LNSSSLDFRYASISFLASSLASFTRFVRSIPLSPFLLELELVYAWLCSHSLAVAQLAFRNHCIASVDKPYLSEQSSGLLSQPIHHQHLPSQFLGAFSRRRTYIKQCLNPRRILCRLRDRLVQNSAHVWRIDIPSCRAPSWLQSLRGVVEARYRWRLR
jgi:hypothetical protein